MNDQPPTVTPDRRRRESPRVTLALALALAFACGPQRGGTQGPPSTTDDPGSSESAPMSSSAATASTVDASSSPDAMTGADSSARADVLSVSVSGSPGAYTFAVEIKSPDTGCDQYADWWEVVTPDGLLLYRRILAHSHVDEQPFTRTGGPVTISASDEVLVRAHMAPGGYGGQVLRGAPDGSFAPAPEKQEGFAESLEESSPLPDSCAF